MKQLTIVLLSSLISVSAFAKKSTVPREGSITCTVGSDYVKFNYSVSFDLANLDNSTGMHEENGRYVLSWSASECEDSSEISFPKQELLDLLSGEDDTIYVPYSHSSPEF